MFFSPKYSMTVQNIFLTTICSEAILEGDCKQTVLITTAARGRC